MNRDIKISLVLGLLLLGAVAAFFFRNEPGSEKQIPYLENPEALAKKMEDTEGPKPYLQNSSFDNGRNQDFIKLDEIETNDEFSAFIGSSSDSEKNSAYEELPATGAINKSQTWKKDRFENRSRTPSPIAKREAVAHNHQTAKRSSPHQTWNALSNRATEKIRPERAASTSEIRIHRVRPGETLSSLATYYLGSDSRFIELYQLNKDVLKNPNRLQVGMKLRIPPAKLSRVVSARTAKTQSTSTIRTPQRAPRLSNDRPASTKPQEKRRTPFSRFLPVRRSPFLPGQQRHNN
jgi:hypothetical protein